MTVVYVPLAEEDHGFSGLRVWLLVALGRPHVTLYQINSLHRCNPGLLEEFEETVRVQCMSDFVVSFSHP